MPKGSDVNDVVRNRFDKATFQRRAEERKRADEEAERERDRAREASRPNTEDPFAPTRPWLEARKDAVDLESKVGKTEIVPGARDKRAGFYCSICESLHKDSQAYLNHMNSRFHQKNLGLSMRVKRATVDEVKDRFKVMKEETKDERKDFNFMERVKRRAEENEKDKKQNRGKGKSKGKPAKEDDEEGGQIRNEDEDVMALMGLPSGFGSSKKK
ncbi:hypothetical protein NDN08_000920 [Rhodosorus marinus]|uniref:U1-type domain-containing protein n=1 Tax=Rhodosorus marinus TaxID=101924 RepID=A0AAV8UTI6_9RHOD|nr:hypothetical protein NDN08_000920 [Rhodosorus marinus]